MFGKKDEKAQPMSGAEMMLRSMGMGEILDMAKAMASAGTFEKILDFANKAEQILEVQKKTNELLEQLLAERRGDANGNTKALSNGNGERPAGVEPGPGPVIGDSGPLLFNGGGLNGASHPDGNVGG